MVVGDGLDQLVAQQGGEPVLEPLPTPPAVGGQQEEHLFVDEPSGCRPRRRRWDGGVRPAPGARPADAGRCGGPTALGEQGGHLGFGGGSTHDVVDRRSTSDDGGRARRGGASRHRPPVPRRARRPTTARRSVSRRARRPWCRARRRAGSASCRTGSRRSGPPPLPAPRWPRSWWRRSHARGTVRSRHRRCVRGCVEIVPVGRPARSAPPPLPPSAQDASDGDGDEPWRPSCPGCEAGDGRLTGGRHVQRSVAGWQVHVAPDTRLAVRRMCSGRTRHRPDQARQVDDTVSST